MENREELVRNNLTSHQNNRNENENAFQSKTVYCPSRKNRENCIHKRVESNLDPSKDEFNDQEIRQQHIRKIFNMHRGVENSKIAHYVCRTITDSGDVDRRKTKSTEKLSIQPKIGMLRSTVSSMQNQNKGNDMKKYRKNSTGQSYFKRRNLSVQNSSINIKNIQAESKIEKNSLGFIKIESLKMKKTYIKTEMSKESIVNLELCKPKIQIVTKKEEELLAWEMNEAEPTIELQEYANILQPKFIPPDCEPPSKKPSLLLKHRKRNNIRFSK